MYEWDQKCNEHRRKCVFPSLFSLYLQKIRAYTEIFWHLEMLSDKANSSSSIEMEKYSEVRKGLYKLAACESTQAHLELWAAAQGNSNPTCNSLYPGPAVYAPSTFLIFLHFIWNKFHEKEQQIQGVRLTSQHSCLHGLPFPPISLPLTVED